jgi:hypothetical protein
VCVLIRYQVDLTFGTFQPYLSGLPDSEWLTLVEVNAEHRRSSLLCAINPLVGYYYVFKFINNMLYY